jgi:hypothetical protein
MSKSVVEPKTPPGNMVNTHCMLSMTAHAKAQPPCSRTHTHTHTHTHARTHTHTHMRGEIYSTYYFSMAMVVLCLRLCVTCTLPLVVQWKCAVHAAEEHEGKQEIKVISVLEKVQVLDKLNREMIVAVMVEMNQTFLSSRKWRVPVLHEVQNFPL